MSLPRRVFFLLVALVSSSRALFFFNAPATTEIYTLSLHDALPICRCNKFNLWVADPRQVTFLCSCKEKLPRSEEHTSELQSLTNLVCRLLLEKKKNKPLTRDVPADAHTKNSTRDHARMFRRNH